MGVGEGGRGYTSYNIHASMINKLCYWSIGFYIPPLAGRPPCIPRTRPVPVATNAKRSYEPDICYSWGNKSQSAILQLCPKDAAGSLPRNKIARYIRAAHTRWSFTSLVRFSLWSWQMLNYYYALDFDEFNHWFDSFMSFLDYASIFCFFFK